MNFSYTLAKSWQDCQFRTKVHNIDRELYLHPGRVYEYGRLAPWVVPVAAHAVTAFLLQNGDNAVHADRLLPENLPLKPEDREKAETRAWESGYRLVRHLWRKVLPPYVELEMIDRKTLFEWKVGCFDNVVIQPDLLTRDRSTGVFTLYDWKWVGDFRDETDLELDLQSVIYQYWLHRAGIKVKKIVWVQGLSDEPTRPAITKQGKVSRALVRCSPEDFRDAVINNGQDPKDYEEVIAQLKPMFKVTEAYRSWDACDQLWNDVCVPLAQEITRYVVGATPARRALGKECHRCWMREECLSGITWGSGIESLNTAWRRKQDAAAITA